MIIMISMLALLTVMTTAIRTNMANGIRNTAIRVTNQTAEALLALPLEDAELTIGSTHSRITDNAAQSNKGFPNTTQKVRDYSMNYTIQWTVTSPTSDLKQISIEVSYQHLNQTYKHNALTYKYRAI